MIQRAPALCVAVAWMSSQVSKNAYCMDNQMYSSYQRKSAKEEICTVKIRPLYTKQFQFFPPQLSLHLQNVIARLRGFI